MRKQPYVQMLTSRNAWRTAAGEKRSAEKCKKLNLTAKSIFGVLGRFLQSRVERNAIDNRSSEKKCCRVVAVSADCD